VRAGIGLARQLELRGERTEARSVLESAYREFTEGFDTPDLQEARVLLEQLS